MVTLGGQVLLVKKDSFKGKEGIVQVQKIDVLDLSGDFSDIRTITDYDLKTEYKVGANVSVPVRVKAYLAKSGRVGTQYTVVKKQ